MSKDGKARISVLEPLEQVRKAPEEDVIGERSGVKEQNDDRKRPEETIQPVVTQEIEPNANSRYQGRNHCEDNR